MYTLESIRKVMTIAKKYENALNAMKIDDIKMCISTGNRKIGRVMNVSLMPVITCHNCSECKHFCYDIKACLQYPDTVINARMRNTVIMMRDRARYFELIESRISRRRTNKYFRWHVAGDIIDLDYFENMVEIAKRHPDFIFWTYTKNYDIVNEYVREHGENRKAAIPANFSIMFSEWDGMRFDNPYNFPCFSCKMKAGNKNHPESYFKNLHKCPGNCDICKAAGRGCIAGESTYCDEH